MNKKLNNMEDLLIEVKDAIDKNGKTLRDIDGNSEATVSLLEDLNSKLNTLNKNIETLISRTNDLIDLQNS